MRFILILWLSFSAYASGNDINKQANDNSNGNKKAYMIDFSKQENGRWRITNDGVMGGLSNGEMTFTQDHGIFSGSISLDNNGGFSSVFRAVDNLPQSYKKLVINTEGDGQAYQLRLIIYVNGYRLAYKHDFKTVANKRENHIFELADFKATFRGRAIPNAPLLNSEDIKEVGFLMTKKVPGQFALSIFTLSFLKQ
ncbi:CIA30 family protein [Colwellia sp. PAMC 20917]|uniref:CIA30 family protein n=1 Tax=Colwellia sp. PAMC 20917 TaxID=1816218 RepID=UPI000ACF3D4B|nr:CIA30 family protein [Colwellia sp. PAMC 20917]